MALVPSLQLSHLVVAWEGKRCDIPAVSPQSCMKKSSSVLLTAASARQPVWPPPHAGTLRCVACQCTSTASQGRCCREGSSSCRSCVRAQLPVPRSRAAGPPGVPMLVTRLSSVQPLLVLKRQLLDGDCSFTDASAAA